MMNLLLTGEIQVGKTTIINRLLEELQLTPSGFKTLRQIIEGKHVGFIMEDLTGIVPVDCNPLYIAKPGGEPRELQRPQGRWEPVTGTFEYWGVKILQESLASPKDLILMDELGHFESTAFTFQRKVLECLSSPIPVLGVVKQRSTDFLDHVRSRADVNIVTITIDNRNEQYDNIKKILRRYLR